MTEYGVQSVTSQRRNIKKIQDKDMVRELKISYEFLKKRVKSPK